MTRHDNGRRRREHRFNVLVTGEIRADLEVVARRQGRSVGELVREGIIHILTKYATVPGNDPSRP